MDNRTLTFAHQNVTAHLLGQLVEGKGGRRARVSPQLTVPIENAPTHVQCRATNPLRQGRLVEKKRLLRPWVRGITLATGDL